MHPGTWIIALFVWLPLTPLSVYAFAIALGLLWLSTVPPTSALVALMFGTRWMAMLFGFAFFSHQVGGVMESVAAISEENAAAIEEVYGSIEGVSNQVKGVGEAAVALAAIAKELLGGNAERIIKKIEETDGTPGALEQALLGCKKIIKLTINEEIADTFLERGRKIIGK